ncbi:hypothetical protein [Microvirga brassicacearum]|uniref:hypothetical protein n=1 Tax=Microvirga brassicacearum TaxID=2580413 RepID=UPI001912802F|nr:hypothetical protein [Microvirga brassicacearum]
MPNLIDNRERDTILAALRHYQADATVAKVSDEIGELATNGGTQDPLSLDEIDELCERINLDYGAELATWIPTCAAILSTEGRSYDEVAADIDSATKSRVRHLVSERMNPIADHVDAARYRFLRSRDLDTIDKGGVFAGRTPENTVLNGEDLDRAVDAAMAPRTSVAQCAARPSARSSITSTATA